MTPSQAQAAVAQYGSQRAAAAALGCSWRSIKKALGTTATIAATPAKIAGTPGKTLADFRATYDKATIIPARVRAALAHLGPNWEYEVDFAKAAGVSLVDLGRFRDQFAENVVQLGREGRRAWANKATAAKMRGML